LGTEDLDCGRIKTAHDFYRVTCTQNITTAPIRRSASSACQNFRFPHGRFTDLAGAPVGLNTTSVLATNGRLHEELLARLGGD